jgi:hypothetical protein
VLAEKQCQPKARDGSPLHFDRNSVEIGSSFGGARLTGVFGSNLPDILGIVLVVQNYYPVVEIEVETR